MSPQFGGSWTLESTSLCHNPMAIIALNRTIREGASYVCETTSTVTTSGSPPQSTTKPELLTCHLWLKEERKSGRARALHYDDNDNSKRELRDPGDDRGLRRLQ